MPEKDKKPPLAANRNSESDPEGGGRWEAFDQIRAEVDQAFDRFFGAAGRTAGQSLGLAKHQYSPAVDLDNEDDRYVVSIETPGMKAEDVELSLDDGHLTIKGEKRSLRQSEDERLIVRERRYGAFERSIRLPDDIDRSKVTATYDDGVIEVTIPKSTAASARSKKITIAKKNTASGNTHRSEATKTT